jgi:Ser/Thr protein kinase RdoA (MazF antagonist)
VKLFKNLTKIGKLRRLRELACAALQQYDLNDPQLDFYAFATNLLFRVTTASGERFMLRLASPGWRTSDDLRSEAMWMQALARDTNVGVPRILPTNSGELVQPLKSADISGIWNATLMSWMPGRLLGKYLNPPNLAKMGALFAALHAHGAAWQPPAGFTTRRFEHWLSRGEENRLIGAAAAGLPAGRGDLLERIHHQVESAYAAIDRSDLRIIHCDLWHDNIKLHRGELHPLDFEDTVLGFRSHDIAMAMLDLLETVGEERYPALLSAFRRGYVAHQPWPAEPIEPFQAGRLLWKINWVAQFQAQHLTEMVEQHAPVFEEFEQSGRIILPKSAQIS